MAALNMESKAWRHEWSTEGEQHRRWRTLGALKDDLNKINASWEFTASRFKPVNGSGQIGTAVRPRFIKHRTGKQRRTQKCGVADTDSHK